MSGFDRKGASGYRQTMRPNRRGASGFAHGNSRHPGIGANPQSDGEWTTPEGKHITLQAMPPPKRESKLPTVHAPGVPPIPLQAISDAKKASDDLDAAVLPVMQEVFAPIGRGVIDIGSKTVGRAVDGLGQALDDATK